jgi:hypothetical protein
VTGLHLEVEVGDQSPPERIECSGGDLEDLAAILADEMVVSIVCEVVHGGAVGEMDVVDQTHLLEIVKKAVHRRLVHVGLAIVHIRRDLFGSRMTTGVFEQGLEDGPAGTSDPLPSRPKMLEYIIEGSRRRHRPSGYNRPTVSPCDLVAFTYS